MARDFLSPGARRWYFEDNAIQPVHGPRAVRRAEFQRQARSHEANRLDTVAETLALVGVLAHKKFFSGYEAITVGKAETQWVKGEGSVVAAHCLPGWMRFNGMLLHDSPEWTPSRLGGQGIKPIPFARKLWNLSARIDLVDVILNKTDSDMERMSSGRGLKPVLGRSAQLLLTRVQHRRPDRWDTLGELVSDAANHYRMHAALVCEERLDSYDVRLKQTHDQATGEMLQDKMLVAETCLGVLHQGTVRPAATTSAGFGSIVRDVIEKLS